MNFPNIYKVSIGLAVVNFLCLLICITTGNTTGIMLNGLFVVFNALTALLNYKLRGYRQREQEKEQARQRQEMIRLTIGS